MDLKTVSLDQVEDQRIGKEITVAAFDRRYATDAFEKRRALAISRFRI